MIGSGEEINTILWLVVAFTSLILVIMFSVSYKRVRSKKLLITTIAFSLFFIKAIVLAMKGFLQNYSDEIWWSVAAFLDIIIICLIVYSLTKKV